MEVESWRRRKSRRKGGGRRLETVSCAITEHGHVTADCAGVEVCTKCQKLQLPIVSAFRSYAIVDQKQACPSGATAYYSK